MSREGDSRFKQWTASLFYKVLGRLSSVDIPRDAGDFRLIDRKVLEAFRAMPEQDRFVRGMFAWLGFRQTEVAFHRLPRLAGETKYPLLKMLRLAANGVIGFSDAPLRLAIWAGFAISALAVLYAGGIGVAVIAAGWHRPSDVIGAYLVTIAWAAGTVAFAATRDDSAYLRTEPSWPDGTLALRYLLGGIGLAALGFLGAVTVAFASETGRIGWTIVDAAFLGACAAVVALAAILMAALLYALRLSLMSEATA